MQRRARFHARKHMLKTIIERLREPLPHPINLGEAISLIHRANRERKAAAVELEKMRKRVGCASCGGDGVVPAAFSKKLIPCSDCHGSG